MAQNNTTLLSPGCWGTTVAVTAQPVLPANPTRVGLIIINSGTSPVAVCPAFIYQSTTGTYTVATAGVPAINGAGSVTMQPGDKFIIDTMAPTCAWNGIAQSTPGALTIFESY